MIIEKERLQKLLGDAIMLLCRTSMQYTKEICIEGLIGITLDKKDVCLISIKELVDNPFGWDKTIECTNDNQSSNFTNCDPTVSVKIEKDNIGKNHSRKANENEKVPLNASHVMDALPCLSLEKSFVSKETDYLSKTSCFTQNLNTSIKIENEPPDIFDSSQCHSTQRNDSSNLDHIQIKSEPEIQSNNTELNIETKQTFKEDNAMYIEDSDDDCHDLDSNNCNSNSFTKTSQNYNNAHFESYNQDDSCYDDGSINVPCSSIDMKFQDYSQYFDGLHSNESIQPHPEWIDSKLMNSIAQNSSQQENKVFICHICQKSYAHLKNMSDHILSVHKGVKFKCPECNKEYNYKKDMQRHKATHQTKFKCYKCCKVFSYRTNLNRHMKNCSIGTIMGITGTTNMLSM